MPIHHVTDFSKGLTGLNHLLNASSLHLYVQFTRHNKDRNGSWVCMPVRACTRRNGNAKN